MNIYLHELRSMLKSAILWTCAVIALAAMFLSIYPSMMSEADEFKKIIEAYPEAVRALLGINLDYITSILGFYSMIFSFIVLCGAIQAMNLGVSVLSKESRERTADFLLVKPVSRMTIAGAKLLAAFTVIIGTNIVFNTAAMLIANAVKTKDYDGKLFIMINLTMLFIQLIFLAVGVVVSVLFRKLKSVLPISLGVVFGLYMASALISAGKADDWTRFISPFRYFDITYIIKNAAYEAKYLVMGAVIAAVSVTAGCIIYNRKDIHAVS